MERSDVTASHSGGVELVSKQVSCQLFPPLRTRGSQSDVTTQNTPRLLHVTTHDAQLRNSCDVSDATRDIIMRAQLGVDGAGELKVVCDECKAEESV